MKKGRALGDIIDKFIFEKKITLEEGKQLLTDIVARKYPGTFTVPDMIKDLGSRKLSAN